MVRRIYVVDDDAGIRGLIAETLRGEGFEVTESLCATTDLADVERVQPDLIVLDCLFGREPLGLDMFRHLKQNQATRDIPIILSSASPLLFEQLEPSLLDQRVALLPRPFQIAALLELVNQQLRDDKAARAGARAAT